VAAQEWARAPGDRVEDRIRRRLRVRASKGAALTGRIPRNSGGGGGEQKNRGAKGRLKMTGLKCNFQSSRDLSINQR
jgi:hypothetical protein